MYSNNVSKLDYHLCVGCGSCSLKCPKSCITMVENEEGFIYPSINDNCISCGSCVKHCPILTPNELHVNLDKRYALILKNKTVLDKSSSGGAFAGFALYILGIKGTVFGASYSNNLVVEHIGITNEKDLLKLQGSKYVRSNLKNSYKQIKELLDNKKIVLFSGSPCQVAGLFSFLGKDYQNLFTMDLICHGTPSPKLFAKYLQWLGNKYHGIVTYYGFRDKDVSGWSCCGKTKIISNNKQKLFYGLCDPYYASFGRCETFRESCYHCYFKRNERIADISIGDFWATDKCYDDIPKENGISFITVNTKKGEELFLKVRQLFDVYDCPVDESLKLNTAYNDQTKRPGVRDEIYKNIDGLTVEEYFSKFRYVNSTRFFCSRLFNKIKRMLKKK